MASFPDTTELISLRSLFTIRSLFVALGIWTVYFIGLGVYRVYFSPLAKIPGPKIAGFTMLYQGYYDVWQRGQYIWRIQEMHEEYGPIIRINPHEIHVNDPEYINEIYTGPSERRDKYRWTERIAATPLSMFGTISHDVHRRRRASMNPYFSKASVRQLEPVIRRSIAKLLKRFERNQRSGEAVPLNLAFKALTGDVTTEYCFGKSFNHLDQEDYNQYHFDSVQKSFEMSHLMLHVGWLGWLVTSLSDSILIKLVPGMRLLAEMRREWIRRIDEIKISKAEGREEDSIFHGLLDSDLPESEKATVRLEQEAHAIVLAGQDTTATTLAALTYHLLANPTSLQKLRNELIAAFPNDPDDDLPTYAISEHLPYLSAVIQEGIRLHPGASLRMQRVSPFKPLYYPSSEEETTTTTTRQWTIPPGTPISMTAHLIQTNPIIFPEPHLFRPERWLEDPRLDRYLLAFSRGTRGCLGINLAYQELSLILASIFRKYTLWEGGDDNSSHGPALALYDTRRERDVDMVADVAVPAVTVGSKGVRILVK